VESYQGRYGIIYGYKGAVTIRQDGSYRIYFDALSKYVELKRQRITQDTYIQNQIDEIVALVESTKYKLNNLI
jgi:predicted LPLAT superfamily acyltransferase